MKKIRVLYILPALNFCGGIENYAMSYYRNINKDKIQIDFITHTELEASFKAEINTLGGKVYAFPPFKIKKLLMILKKIDDFFKNHAKEYNIIHCHMANAAFFYFKIAKKYNVNIRILHSHQPSASDKLLHKIRNYPLLFWGNKLATHRIACTKLAGDFLFKNYSYKIIRNAINTKRFEFNQYKRLNLRKSLGLENKYVVGHVGRFCAQKNQLFVLEIFKEILEKKENAYLIFVGAGEDKLIIEKKIKEWNLLDKVKIIAPCNNIEDYYQIFDVFVFPSIYEGLGIVLIEAQCSGLRTYTSKENIPQDVKVTEKLQFLSLKYNNAKMWAKKILYDDKFKYDRCGDLTSIKNYGYDINTEVKVLENYYINIVQLEG